MDTLDSTAAANRLGVNAQRFHRLVAQHNLTPILKGPGRTGVMFWDPTDIDRIATTLEAERAS